MTNLKFAHNANRLRVGDKVRLPAIKMSRPKTSVEIQCPACGKRHTRKKSQIDAGSLCCSVSCGQKLKWKSRRLLDGKHESVEETKTRFLRWVIKTDYCWLWQGFLNKGYGRFAWNGKYLGAHVASFELFKGIACSKGKLVRHTCDVTWCVNPDHLLLGTRQDNSNDMVERLRFNQKNSKLSREQVLSIRSDARLQKVIAEEFDVSVGTVGAIKSGRTFWYVV